MKHFSTGLILTVLVCVLFGSLNLKAGNQPVTGRYVRVQAGPGVNAELNFSELEVYADGGNLALNKSTSAASQYSDEFAASKAVDGITDGVNTYSSLEKTNQWWEVDLGQEYDIEKIVIYNRTSAPARLNGYQLVILDAAKTEKSNITLTADGTSLVITQVYYINMSKPLPERRDDIAPKFGAPSSDTAYVMPVGSGDVSAMLRYNDKYEMHLSKQDFLSVDNPNLTFHWATKHIRRDIFPLISGCLILD